MLALRTSRSGGFLRLRPAYAAEGPPPDPIKGIRLSMGDGASLVTSVAGITALWWYEYPPAGAPDYETTVSIDASGLLTIDLDAVTALGLGDYGTLGITKPDAVLPASRGNLFPVQIVDIA